jgi:uncharacterized SAM-binding protein YcdF (DUF218 family)
MFVLSKILWIAIAPGTIILALLVAGAALLWTRWRRAGRNILALGVAAAVIVAVLPIGSWLLLPLENRFPTVTQLPDKVDGIVVLGGAVSQHLTRERGQPSLNEAAERMTAFAGLVRRLPGARPVFTGGSAAIFDTELKEAEVARRLFAELGLDVTRITFEDRSRNTYENALYTREVMQPKPGETWLLVTSAFHMPRAYGCFSRVGWKVLPYPVDYMTDGTYRFGLGLSLGGGLNTIEFAIHEWVGLVYYRLRGYTDALFPKRLIPEDN